MKNIQCLTVAVILCVLTLFTSRSAQAQTVYVGNSLTVPNGAPDGVLPLIILGEYSPAGPLATPRPRRPCAPGLFRTHILRTELQFALYALSLVASSPNANEQTFRVVAKESFSGNNSTPSTE